MVSWAPGVEDVSGLVQGWAHAADISGVVPLIDQAAAEVVGEVGSFNPSLEINPEAPQSDRITLGDLARNASALRAAYHWASGLAPELSVDFTPSLHARYLDALARLRSHVNRLTASSNRRVLGSVLLRRC